MSEIRERLLEAADERLSTGGYAAVQIAPVAKAAGVATGTVYLHFPSKAALAIALFERIVASEVEAVAEAAASVPGAVARLSAATETFVRRAAATPDRAGALLAEPSLPEVEAVRQSYRREFALIYEGVLRDGVQAGELAPCAADVVSTAIIGALSEATFGVFRRREPVDVDGLVRTLQDFVVAAVSERSSHVDA